MKFVYQEFARTPPLSDAVVVFWSFAPHPGEGQSGDLPVPLPFQVLPDGCADLIVGLAPPALSGAPREAVLRISGALSRSKIVEIAPRTHLWGMQLRPGWVETVLGIPALALPSRLEQVERHSPRLAELARVLRATSLPDAVEAVFRDGITCLIADASERGRSRGSAPTPHLREALRLLEASGGRIRMNALARAVGLSERTLHRQLSGSLGMPPKSFARILRFQDAVSRLRIGHQSEVRDLAGLARDSGYFDQAHMTHEFRTLTGLTPATLPLSPYPEQKSLASI
ncbi:MAG: helix-turn-helix transcriptional regulator [Cytophagales bacterium]|nr:helix-turn-helix transcriptional regulator [Armatimonadota bacterium]